jgi:hypothetical protein
VICIEPTDRTALHAASLLPEWLRCIHDPIRTATAASNREITVPFVGAPAAGDVNGVAVAFAAKLIAFSAAGTTGLAHSRRA